MDSLIAVSVGLSFPPVLSSLSDHLSRNQNEIRFRRTRSSISRLRRIQVLPLALVALIW